MVGKEGPGPKALSTGSVSYQLLELRHASQCLWASVSPPEDGDNPFLTDW